MRNYINQRKNRSLRERIFLVGAEHDKHNFWKFEVEGTSGTVYKVRIDPSGMSCTCPDCTQRRRICKHIYFIISRVAKNNYLLDKVGSDLEYNLFCENDNLTDSLKNRLLSRLEGENIDKQEITEPYDDPCSICFEEVCGNENVSKCMTCKKYFHYKCITVWLRRSSTCPLCRGIWDSIPSSNDELDHLNLDSLRISN